MPISAPRTAQWLQPERVAYWYFRLNGFLQIENFIVHPDRHGSQRTDADLLGVRFGYRKEFAFNERGAVMIDDDRLRLSTCFDDIVIAEVKTNQPCTLNGPWTKRDRRNVHRVLAAIGCLPERTIPEAAEAIYNQGSAVLGRIRISLVAIGRNRSQELDHRYPKVLQLTWDDVLRVVWDRFDRFREQKRHVDQWDNCGKRLRQEAENASSDEFVGLIKGLMGVAHLEAGDRT
jgi:hypothetical protein